MENKNRKYWIIGGVILLLLIVFAIMKSGGDEGDQVETSIVLLCSVIATNINSFNQKTKDFHLSAMCKDT